MQCVVTSPPYWGLRDYGVEGQIGLEPTPEQYVANMVAVFREVLRVLRDDGTLWLNLGDSYASSPPGNTTLGVSAKSTLHGVNGPSDAYRATLAQSVQQKRNTIVGASSPRISSASPGASPSPCRQTAGISARTSSGRSRTPCPRASPIGPPRRTSTCF